MIALSTTNVKILAQYHRCGESVHDGEFIVCPASIRINDLTNRDRYIFEDLITAGDLFTFVESKGGSITDFEAASVIQQIVVAVDYLHDNNIVHRDLKPENILMTSHGVKRRVVLADFGCAQIVSARTKRMSTVVGTWDYTAPYAQS